MENKAQTPISTHSLHCADKFALVLQQVYKKIKNIQYRTENYHDKEPYSFEVA